MLKPLPENGFCPICHEFEDECECPRYPATMDKYRINLRAPGELLYLSKINEVREGAMQMDEQEQSEKVEHDTWCMLCGSQAINLLGYDDGGGDFGTAITAEWECLECGDRWSEVVYEDRSAGYG